MIRYNWQDIYKYANGDCNEIINILYDIVFRNVSVIGSSKQEYMVDPESLLINSSNASKSEMCTYIYLCSLRNYFNYKTYNERHLNKDVAIAALGRKAFDKLRHNRLVTITDKNIILIYEEK